MLPQIAVADNRADPTQSSSLSAPPRSGGSEGSSEYVLRSNALWKQFGRRGEFSLFN